MVKGEARFSDWGARIRAGALLLLAIPALLALGVGIILFNPLYSLIVAGVFLLLVLLWLRLDELVAALIIAAHLWLDAYLGLYQVALCIALALLAVCLLGRSAVRPWTVPRLAWGWALLLGLGLYPMLLGAPFSLTNAGSYYVNLFLHALLLFWLGNLLAKETAALRRVFSWLALLGALIALHTIVQATTGVFLFLSARTESLLLQYANFQITGFGASRAGSFFGNPNGNATFLATCFFLPLGLFIQSKQLLMKGVYLLELLAILLALLFTYSSGALIAALAGIGVFVFLAGRVRSSLLLLLLIGVLGTIAVSVFPSQILTQLQRANDPNDLSLHLGAWQTALRVIQAFPLFGVGLGSQAYLVRADPFRVPAQTLPLQEPDNSYLQIGAIAGLPALVVFLFLLGSAFWFAWRNWRASEPDDRPLLGSAIAALVALSVNSLTVDGWTNPIAQVNLGWLIAGLVASPLLAARLRPSEPPARDAEGATTRKRLRGVPHA